VKIADLGFAKQLKSEDDMTTTVLGTPYVMAPEVLEKQSYGMESDAFSFGVISYFMLYSVYPFHGNNEYQLLKNIKYGKVSYPSTVKVSEEMLDFIQRLLVYDQKKRMSWKEMYDHALVQKASKEQFVFSNFGLHNEI